jgi:hypothetical protein
MRQVNGNGAIASAQLGFRVAGDERHSLVLGWLGTNEVSPHRHQVKRSWSSWDLGNGQAALLRPLGQRCEACFIAAGGARRLSGSTWTPRHLSRNAAMLSQPRASAAPPWVHGDHRSPKPQRGALGVVGALSQSPNRSRARHDRFGRPAAI